MAKQMEAPRNVGVINPFALAEVVDQTTIDWKEVDVQDVLAETFGMPYEQLFDPKFDSPLYVGLQLDPDTLEMERIELPEVEINGGAVETAAQASDADMPISDAERELDGMGVPQVMAAVMASASWKDPGTFFHEAAEATDPIQGALGDCYFIAALSSVAWARTYDIAHRTRATGTNQQGFVDMVVFHDKGKEVRVEVSEKLPLNTPGNGYIYARSSESGEIWPAVYEKAYAKWRTNHSGDTPSYPPIAGGDPVGAAAQLTGLKPYYYGTKSLSGDEIWTKVRENSISRKTFNPMVAWTYSSGDKSPDKVNYNNAQIAANHAYSILGWDYQDKKKYVVLRNPWGTYESVVGVKSFTWYAWDAPYYGGPGWWRPTQMASPDGTFAIEASVFKKYFAGLGAVKP